MNTPRLPPRPSSTLPAELLEFGTDPSEIAAQAAGELCAELCELRRRFQRGEIGVLEHMDLELMINKRHALVWGPFSLQVWLSQFDDARVGH